MTLLRTPVGFVLFYKTEKMNKSSRLFGFVFVNLQFLSVTECSEDTYLGHDDFVFRKIFVVLL